MTASYQHYATHDESEYPHLWLGVVGAWAPCLGPSGTRLHDHSGRANWGTLTNMDPDTDWQIDAGQYALRFRGVNQYVGANFFNVAASDFSLSIWHKNTRSGSGDWDTMVAIGGGSGGFMLDGYAGQTTRRYTIRRSGVGDQILGSTTYALNQWNHIGYIQTGEFGALYLNGKADSALTSVGPFAANVDASFLTVGSFYQGQFSLSVDGLVDDLLIYDRPVSANGIAELYQIGRGGMYTPRRRRRAYFGPLFQAAWARGSNVLLQPCGVS